MDNCRFCSGEKIGPEYLGSGMKTMSMNLRLLFGTEDDPPIDGLRLENGHTLAYNNSAEEYADQMIDIVYCPFCGRKLITNQNDL